jgi:hypothetical protein
LCLWIKKYKDHINYDIDVDQKLIGVSRYRSWKDEEGNSHGEWVKTSKSQEEIKEAMQEYATGLADEIPKAKRIEVPDHWHKGLCSVIPIGDAHIGMFAWDKETGENWDLMRAEHYMCSAFDYLVDKSVSCEKCIIINVGDYFHYHAMEAKTERSGHILDAAGRPQGMIQTGMKIMRYAIERAARKHGSVEVINASGNHDGLLAFMLSIALKNIYEDCDHITINTQPTFRHYTRWGKVLIGVTHGDKARDPQLGYIMAEEVPQLWGETTLRTWFRGHHHHNNAALQSTRVDHGRVVVEQVATIAAGDAYAVNNGYLSNRDMKSIIFHESGAEVDRHTCSIQMLEVLS